MVQLKPDIPTWVPPPATREDLDWASLKTLDLSLLDSEDPLVVDQLIADTKDAIVNDGFLYLVNYGVPLDELYRQFSIAQYLLQPGVITEDEKERLKTQQQYTGSYAGYKAPSGWGRGGGAYDGIENFTFYSPQMADPAFRPKALEPFMDEVKSFWSHCHNDVNRRLLQLLSRALELPKDYLWDNVQSHGEQKGEEICGEGYFRMVVYHAMTDVENRNDTRIHGHCDLGTTTLLFSVPITALQVHTPRENKWQWVKYKPGALVINIGESLEILTGGHFKATRHRVVQPPDDQLQYDRLSCAMFCSPRGDLHISPLTDSPLIQREGLKREGVFKEFAKLLDAGIEIPNHDEWRRGRRAIAQQAPKVFHTVNGIQHYEETVKGISVLTPV